MKNYLMNIIHIVV